jgi:hypothetical protein
MRAGVHRSSAAAGRGRRPLRRGAATAALACVAAALVLFASACDLGAGDAGSEADAEQARVLEHARTQLGRAAASLRDGDSAAFAEALPVDTAAASAGRLRERLDEVCAALSPVPWSSFGFSVAPLPDREGVYRVVGSGRLGATGPADRLAVIRYLRLVPAGDGVAVSADVTPEDLRRRYLMALHDPVVLQRPGFVVLADRWARDRAQTVAAAAGRARPRLEALGLDVSPTVLVTIYGSAEDVRDALAVRLPSVRLRFFAHLPLRVAEEDWEVDDVGVMGPWLRDPGESIDGVFVHELAHAYTVRWFEDDAEPPALLVEGIAAAAEGVPVSAGLRDEVASGNQLWPLPESFAVDDVWDGGDMEAIGLGYEVGRSLVDYVDVRWGASRLEDFVRAVTGAQPTEAGLDAALEGALGVSWDEFYTGWRRFVLRGG